jgi:hypothetical protein
MNKEYYFYINQNMTVLTAEGNWRGQLDNCYVIVDVGWVVMIVDEGGC